MSSAKLHLPSIPLGLFLGGMAMQFPTFQYNYTCLAFGAIDDEVVLYSFEIYFKLILVPSRSNEDTVVP